MQSDGPRVLSLCGAPAESIRLTAPLDLVVVARGECWVRFSDGGPASAATGAAIVAALSSRTASLEIVAASGLELVCFAGDARGSEIGERVVGAGEIARDARLAALRDLLVSEGRARTPSLELCAHLVAAFLLAASEPGRDWSSGDAVVSRALSIMRERIGDSLRISELARAVGLSRAAFARRFRDAVGEPPERHWAKLRMQRAAELLVATDDGMAAIAADVGFSSEFAFSRAFKRWHGVPPGEYRRRMQQSADRPRMAA